VTRIGIIDRRRIIKRDAISAYGTVLRDEGKRSARLLIEGKFVGEEATKGITSLRTKYKKGEPLTLISSMSFLSNIHKVLIEDIQIQTSYAVQLAYNYQLILREYVETVPAKDGPPPSQKGDALQQVNSQATNTLQEMKQDSAGVLQDAQALEGLTSKAGGDIEKLKQASSDALQKAKALEEIGSQAVDAFQNLDNDNLTPSQKAEALQQVGLKAADAKKEIEEEYF
jgi:hypothetical protein